MDIISSDEKPESISSTPPAIPTQQRFKAIVGVHLLLLDGDNVLLCQRQNTGFGDGLFHPPAGHLEPDESVIDCAIREAREELDITLSPDDLTLAHVVHSFTPFEAQGRIQIFFTASTWTGELRNAEPESCAQIQWFPLTELPTNMVDYSNAAIRLFQTDQTFSVHGLPQGWG